MNPPIDLYCGAPVEIDSEQAFLKQLREDLALRKQRALIFANFFTQKKPLQIDFFIVTQVAACHVELKHLTAPVVGRNNGPWHLLQADGSHVSLGPKSPYRQALDGKYSISDEMHQFARLNSTVPTPPQGKKFYTQFESVVCVYPELLPQSDTFEDFRVRVRGYADLLAILDAGTKRSTWSWKEWLSFAMHLSLVKATESESVVPLAIRDAAAAVASYVRLYEDFHNRGLPPLVPTGLTGPQASLRSEELAAFVTTGRHVQLVGPSGFGKTLRSRHLGLEALRAGRLPIFVAAGEYNGNLSALLDRSVAHLHPDSSLSLLTAAAAIGRPVTLIFDGFNECPEHDRSGLLRDLQAMYLRWKPALLLSTKEIIELGEPLSSEIVSCLPLLSVEREAVIRAYLSGRDPADITALCDGFQSPYELSVAAACAEEHTSRLTRAALFDGYVRKQCGITVAGTAIRIALRAVAGEMSERLSGSLPLGDVWRVLETTLSAHGLPLTHISNVLDCSLVVINQGRCTFRHELLEQFFKAEWLRLIHPESEHFAQELSRPRYRPLAEMSLGMESDAATVRSCLELLADSKSITATLRGRWGETARIAATNLCSDILRRADTSLETMEVSLVGAERSRRLRMGGVNAWTPSESAALCGLAETISSGLFLREVMTLTRRTEERCIELLLPEFGQDGILPRIARAELFAGLYSFNHEGDLLPAISTITRTLQSWYPSDGEAVFGSISPWLDNLDDLFEGELLLLCLLLRGAGREAGPVIAPFLRCCWRKGIYHLRLEVLRTVEGFASQLQGVNLDAVTGFLSGLHSNNIFLSTQIVETLSCYGLLTPPVSQEAANEEVANVLAAEDCEVTRNEAYGIVTRIFEDVFQGVYFYAIDSLQPSDRARLLAMSALGSPDHSSTPDWVLGELRKYDDPIVLPAFQHFASRINIESFSSQEAVASYAKAVAGCARFLDEPIVLNSPATDEGKAWEEYGAILFWLAKPGLTEEERRKACATHWRCLETDFAFEAVDPLFQFHRAGWISFGASARPLEIVSSAFPQEVRRILEFGMQHHARITGIFPSAWNDDERRIFLVNQLGDLGNEHSTRLLEPWADDALLGGHVVEALRKLEGTVRITGHCTAG